MFCSAQLERCLGLLTLFPFTVKNIPTDDYVASKLTFGERLGARSTNEPQLTLAVVTVRILERPGIVVGLCATIPQLGRSYQALLRANVGSGGLRETGGGQSRHRYMTEQPAHQWVRVVR